MIKKKLDMKTQRQSRSRTMRRSQYEERREVKLIFSMKTHTWKIEDEDTTILLKIL